MKSGEAMRLECRNIQFCYPGTIMPILDDLSLVLDEPGLHGLFGPSGVGKTSLAKIIAGALQPGSGKILADGMHPGQESAGGGQDTNTTTDRPLPDGTG